MGSSTVHTKAFRRLVVMVEDDDGELRPVLDRKCAWDLTESRTPQEIRSNPALAAIMAGAPPEIAANLPGDHLLGYLITDHEIVITLHLPLPAGEFVEVGGR